MKNWITRLDDWIFSSYPMDDKTLGAFRIILAAYFLFFKGIPRFEELLAPFPDGVYNPPPGIARLFDGIPSMAVIQIADILIPILFLLLLFGLFTRVVSILLPLVIVTFYGFYFSAGKINHHFIAWFAIFMMAFSNWGKAYSLDAYFGLSKGKTTTWPVTFLSVVLGFGWFTAGAIKLGGNWLSTSFSMTKGYYLRNFYRYDRQDFLSEVIMQVNSNFFWEFLDWFTIIFEIGIFLAIFTPIFYRFFTLIAIFFHLMVVLMLNIGGFAIYLPLYFLFWLPILGINFSSFKVRPWLIGLSALAAISLIVHYTTGQAPFQYLLNTGRHPQTANLVLIALVNAAWIYALIFRTEVLFRKAADLNTGSPKPVLFFDGVCNLCNGFIQFVVKRDPKSNFSFASLQSEVASKFEDRLNEPLGALKTVYLVDGEKVYKKSNAALEVARRLKGFYPLLYLTKVVPLFIRNAMYNFVAKYRYKWFGKKDQCMVPTPELKSRFID